MNTDKCIKAHPSEPAKQRFNGTRARAPSTETCVVVQKGRDRERTRAIVVACNERGDYWWVDSHHRKKKKKRESKKAAVARLYRRGRSVSLPSFAISYTRWSRHPGLVSSCGALSTHVYCSLSLLTLSCTSVLLALLSRHALCDMFRARSTLG